MSTSDGDPTREGARASLTRNSRHRQSRSESFNILDPAELGRQWSSSGYELSQSSNHQSPFLVAPEANPFGDSWVGGFGESSRQVAEGQVSRNSGVANLGPTRLQEQISSSQLLPLSSMHHSMSIVDGIADTAQSGLAMEGGSLPSSSRIHDAARITDWNKVKELCKLYPIDAEYAGRDGWTALHHLCNRRCPDVEAAECLIRAYPDALVQQDEKGWTPLHYACRFKLPKEVVRLVLQLYPKRAMKAVSKKEKQGRTPLFYAVRYDAPPGVVGMLLEMDPSVVLEEDQNADSPLAVVWDDWVEKTEGRRVLHPFLHTDNNAAPKSPAMLLQMLKEQSKLSPRWLKVNMFLKAHFGFPIAEATVDRPKEKKPKDTENERKWRIVHATAAVKCHPKLFQMALALHPEQVKEIDEDELYGPINNSTNKSHQTALHLAAASNASGEAGRAVIAALLNMFPKAVHVADGIDGSLPLHRIVENKFKSHWTSDGANSIFMANPRAVYHADQKGRLPLHRAAAAIVHPEPPVDASTETTAATAAIICNLLSVNREGASKVDNFGCMPLHLVAQNGQTWDIVVQALLEAAPNAVTVRAGPDWYNRLPIHLAAANPNTYHPSLVRRLVELNPRGCTLEDSRGKFPFHLACEVGKDWDSGGLREIYEAYPEAVQIAENNPRHWTPLHLAAASPNSSGALLTKLIELYPHPCSVPDNNGRYPLHLAVVSGKSWHEGLKVIFEHYPVALSTVDNQGYLPLHLAALAAATAKEEEEALHEEESCNFNESVNLEASGKMEEGLAQELDVIFCLLRADPTAL